MDKLQTIAECKPKVKEMLDKLLTVMVNRKTGTIEIRLSEGAVLQMYFREQLMK